MKNLGCLNRIRVDHRVFVPHHPVDQHLTGHISIMTLRSVSLVKEVCITLIYNLHDLAAARVDQTIQPRATSTQGVQGCCWPQAGQIDPKLCRTRRKGRPT